MNSGFQYDENGQKFKVYASTPLRVVQHETEDTYMGMQSFVEAGRALCEKTRVLMEEAGVEDFGEAFQETLDGNPQLKEIYALGPIVRPSIPETPHIRKVADEVDRRVKRYLHDHNLHPVSDYHMALMSILADDPALAEAYNAMGGNVWEN